MQLSRAGIDELERQESVPQQECRAIVVASRFPVVDSGRTTFFSVDSKKKYTVVPIPPAASGKLKRFYQIVTLTFQVLHAVRQARPDLIVLEDPRAGMPCCLLLRLLFVRIPIVIWNFNLVKPYKSIKKWFTRTAIQAAYAMVVYSSHEQKLYSELFDLPLSKFRFKLYTGPYLDDPRYQTLSERPCDFDYVVSPGSWGRDYQLLAKVAAEVPSIRFVVLAIAEAVVGVEFPSNVEVVNGIQELEYCRYIAHARACYVPVANQITANGHIAIVQAMCFKTPLITNPTPGTVDYLDERTTIECSDNDPDSIASQISDVFDNGEKYEAMVNAAYEFSRENFGVDQDIAMIDSVLSSINKPSGS